MKVVIFWIIAVVITLGAMVYQRKTGPTYPKKSELTLEGKSYTFGLTRSHGGITDCPLVFALSDTAVSGKISFRKFPTSEEWTVIPMVRNGENLTVALPN